MSTSFSAHVMWGIRLTSDETNKREPNPLWGKHTYDPDTGNKVTRYIEEEIELDCSELAKHKLVLIWGDYDKGEVCVGKLLAEADLNYGGSVTRFKLPTPDEAAKFTSAIKAYCAALDIHFDPVHVGLMLVGSVG